MHDAKLSCGPAGRLVYAPMAVGTLSLDAVRASNSIALRWKEESTAAGSAPRYVNLESRRCPTTPMQVDDGLDVPMTRDERGLPPRAPQSSSDPDSISDDVNRHMLAAT